MWLHRTPEGNLHEQLDDSLLTQRKQQYQHQERSTTGRYHIAQAVYGSTRKHITMHVNWSINQSLIPLHHVA